MLPLQFIDISVWRKGGERYGIRRRSKVGILLEIARRASEPGRVGRVGGM